MRCEVCEEICNFSGINCAGGERYAGAEVGSEVCGDENGSGVEQDDVAARAGFTGEDGGEDGGVGVGVASNEGLGEARVRPASSGVIVERVTTPLWTSAI